MRIEHLQLKNVRNIASCSLELSPGVNFIYGNNAQGKTNLVEAIHFLATLDFHRGQSADFIRHGQQSARLTARVEVEGLHRNIDITIEKRRNAITVDGDSVRRARNYLGQVLSVAFFPEDMLVLLMEPALRRRWMDRLLSLYHIPYRDTISKAKKALDSRNRLLREPQPPQPALLGSIDATLAPLAAEIMVKRREIISVLEGEIKKIFSDDFSGAGEPSLEYYPSFKNCILGDIEEISTAYLEALNAGRERDIASRTTLTGPHRDDFIMAINSQPVRAYASRGEVRTALLSLNLAKLSVLKKKYGHDPIVILDDILSELDKDRRHKVLKALPENSQIFITSTEKDDSIVDITKDVAFWLVEAGEVSAG